MSSRVIKREIYVYTQVKNAIMKISLQDITEKEHYD